jgi:hypothetical protein
MRLACRSSDLASRTSFPFDTLSNHLLPSHSVLLGSRHIPEHYLDPKATTPAAVSLALYTISTQYGKAQIHLQPTNKQLAHNHNVRAWPRIPPYQRRSTQQTAHQAARPHTALRTCNRNQNTLQRPIKGDPTPGFQPTFGTLAVCTTGDCDQCPGFFGRSGLGRIPRLQGKSAAGV